MTFGKEKRLLLAGLSALAPVPLPFNDVLSWPLLLIYLGFVGLFMNRWSSGEGRPLPTWSMNVLGGLYLPILAAEFSLLWRGYLLQPLIHLALFTLVVKLFGMACEKDKWHVFLLTVFVFVAAMGTSVHPSVALYLVVFAALGIFLLSRFAAYHVLSSFGPEATLGKRLPMGRFVVVVTLVSTVAAVPIFLLLPRLGTPYVSAPFLASSGAVQQTGFTEEITLDTIGRVRTSRVVAMRLAYETPPPPGHAMRFKAAAYSLFRGARWFKGPAEVASVQRSLDGFFHLSSEDARSWVKVWLQPPRGDELALPVEATAVDINQRRLLWNGAGIASVEHSRPGALEYRVGMSSRTDPDQLSIELPGPGELDPPAGGVSERITRLAREVSGGGDVAERAGRIERFLMSEYEYTLDLVGAVSEDPVEDFLFSWRKGHCEYFATSMVLMLRSVGISARLATGFLGGEFNPMEGYFIVRQSNAHAWVEAHVPGRGWRVFDPTPPDGRPQRRPADWRNLLSQAYDFVVFRWDRHVLTFGFTDQVGLVRQVLLMWRDLWEEWADEQGETEPSSAEPKPEPFAKPRTDAQGAPELGLLWLLLAACLVAAAHWMWRHRPQFDAGQAYRRLRSRVEHEDWLPRGRATTAQDVEDAVSAHWPDAAAPAARIVGLYLRESFGGDELEPSERTELKATLRQVLGEIRRAS